MIISLWLQQTCNDAPWGPCLPEGNFSPRPAIWLLLAFLALAFVVLIIFLRQAFVRPVSSKKLTLPNARGAAERISSEQRNLPMLQGDALTGVCKTIAHDLLLIVDFTLLEAAQYEDEDENVLAAIHNVRYGAHSLRSSVEWALFLLKFRSQAAEGQFLVAEATSRYVSVLAPALKELHNRRTDARDRIPIFEIKPGECQP